MSQWVARIGDVLYHTVRMDNGSDNAPWQHGWGNVMSQVGNAPAPIAQIGCGADTAGNLQIVICTGIGKLFHTLRHADGTWQNFWGDVFAHSGTPPQAIIDMACGPGTDNTFQIAILLEDGKTVLHTVRNGDGSWQKAWGNVNGHVGNLPSGTVVELAGA
jgi:hypothetical protein